MSFRSLCLLCLSCIFLVQTQENPIKHLIILMMENRSFDHYLGWLKQTNNSKIDGLNGDEFNCVVPNDTSSKCVTVSKGGYDTGPDDPDHSFDGTAEEIYGYNKKVGVVGVPKQDGFVYNANMKHHDLTNPMRMFTVTNSSSHVLNTLALEYGIFDNWFCSMPGPTDPNRGYAMSGTSNGMINDWNGTKWNQQSYFDLLTKNNISWAGYYYATIWALGYFEDLTKKPNSQKIYPFSQFYDDLKKNDLSSFIWLQPTGSSTQEFGPANWQHPDASVELGEKLIQNVYEALKNSTYWNSSALIITYDEHGGFYDHVPPPQTNIPPPDGVVSPSNGFKFDRLGIRIPTVVVSPWIDAGTIIHDSNGPTQTSQYEGTSNIATSNKLFGLNKYLGDRMKWSATYDHIFLQRTTPRTDDGAVFDPVIPWTIEDVELQSAKPLNDQLENQVQFFCDELNIQECPVFDNQGDASEFMIKMMPTYMKKIQS